GSLVNDREGLVGVTRDERMAVFCLDETRGGLRAVTPAYSIRVIDLSTGRELSSIARNSSMASINSSEEFFSIRSAFVPVGPDDPLVGRWKLAGDGTWEPANAERQLVFPDKLLSIAEAADGSLRLMGEKEISPAGENVTQAEALAASPSGERFLA